MQLAFSEMCIILETIGVLDAEMEGILQKREVSAIKLIIKCKWRLIPVLWKLKLAGIAAICLFALKRPNKLYFDSYFYFC